MRGCYCLIVCLFHTHIYGALRYTGILIGFQNAAAPGDRSKSSVLGIVGGGGERFREKKAQTRIMVEMGTYP